MKIICRCYAAHRAAVWVGPLVVKELKRIVDSSEITRYVATSLSCGVYSYFFREDDTNWPKKNIVGKQELEIRIGSDHIAFEVRNIVTDLCCSYTVLQTAKIGSLVEIQDSEDPEGLRVFYYLVQDLKASPLISCQFSLTLHSSVSFSRSFLFTSRSSPSNRRFLLIRSFRFLPRSYWSYVTNVLASRGNTLLKFVPARMCCILVTR